jgi:hypothetical protein
MSPDLVVDRTQLESHRHISDAPKDLSTSRVLLTLRRHENLVPLLTIETQLLQSRTDSFFSMVSLRTIDMADPSLERHFDALSQTFRLVGAIHLNEGVVPVVESDSLADWHLEK